MKKNLAAIKKDALTRAPLIFENHFLKAFWMLGELSECLAPKSESVQKVWERIETTQYPAALAPLSESVHFPLEISKIRRKSIVNRGLFPSAYAALWLEICEGGAQALERLCRASHSRSRIFGTSIEYS